MSVRQSTARKEKGWSCKCHEFSTHPAILKAHALQHGDPDIVSTGEVHHGVVVVQKGHQVPVQLLEQWWQCEVAAIRGVADHTK